MSLHLHQPSKPTGLAWAAAAEKRASPTTDAPATPKRLKTESSHTIDGTWHDIKDKRVDNLRSTELTSISRVLVATTKRPIRGDGLTMRVSDARARWMSDIKSINSTLDAYFVRWYTAGWIRSFQLVNDWFISQTKDTGSKGLLY